MRSIFIIFKGLLVAQNYLRPESAPLRSGNAESLKNNQNN